MSLGWVGARWMNLVERSANEKALAEGFEYARAGQTRTLDVEPGRIVALVQGRALRAYRVVIQLECFSDEDWTAIVDTVAAQPRYGARLLAGELPEAMSEVFEKQGCQLLPEHADQLLVTSTCTSEPGWSKHVCCAAMLIAERLDQNPGMILALRGLPLEELMDRIRERRADLGTEGSTSAPPALETDLSKDRSPARPLEGCLDEFWEAGRGLEQIETTIRAPEVSHALLRRLGPSPFDGSRFPLVGLLATCYDVIGQSVLTGEREGTQEQCEPLSEPETDQD